MKILFVCTGGAGRSQIAEGLYNHLTRSHDALGAGTEAIVGKPMPPDVIEVMKEVGIDVSRSYRRQITEAMCQQADTIILMTDKSLPTYLKNNPKVITWNIPDPRHLGLEVHRQTRDDIRARIDALLDNS